MRLTRHAWLLLATALGFDARTPASGQVRSRPDDAFALAYRYALPVYEIARVRYALQLDPLAPVRLSSNHLFHGRALAAPASRLITTPNADTLYSLAFLDLRNGPVRVDVPDTDDRYYSLAFMDCYTNNFAYVGRRTTGTRAGSYLVTGPHAARGKSGPAVIAAPTADVLLLARILVRGPDDLDAVRRLQQGFVVRGPATAPRPLASTPAPGSGERFVAIVNGVLADNPPPGADATVLQSIAAVGVGPSTEPLRAELRRAWNERFSALERAFAATVRAGRTIAHGWSYPPVDIGRYGTDYDARARTALVGLLANVREEDMDLGAVADAGGAPLDARGSYRLRLPARMPVDAFWSISVYERQPDGRLYFADNPLHRSVIGDRTRELRRNADGSLDLFIQRDPPAPERRTNWLPLPAGPFALMMRNYQPRPELLDGRFRYPAVERA
jgi:hypothetical protein